MPRGLRIGHSLGGGPRTLAADPAAYALTGRDLGLNYSGAGASLLQANDVSLLGAYDFRPGTDTIFYKGFAIRRVGAEVRFITHPLGAGLFEFTFAGRSYGQTITTPTQTWAITGVQMTPNRHEALMYDAEFNRVFMLQAKDYADMGETPPWPTNLWVMGLGSGVVTSPYKISLEGVPDRKTLSGAAIVPPELRAALGGSYLLGMGGYASQQTANGGVSLGLSAYAIPDPEAYRAAAPPSPDYQASGAIIPASAFKQVAGTDTVNRGVRHWWGYQFTQTGTDPVFGHPIGAFSPVAGQPTFGPLAYFLPPDGGARDSSDPGAFNYVPVAGPPPYYNYVGPYPTPPNGLSSVALWLWGDRYAGGGFVTGAKRGFLQVGFFGAGRQGYFNSQGVGDQQVAEVHVFDPNDLAEVAAGTRSANNVFPRAIIPLPDTVAPGIDSGYGAFSAGYADYDAVGKRLYVLMFQAGRPGVPGSDAGLAKLYEYAVNA